MEMKIFMVCDVWLDGRDAQTTHVLELFKNLGKLRDTHLFAPRPKKLVNEAQNTIFVPTVMPIFKSAFYQLFLFFYLIFHCPKRSPNVIYSRCSSLTFSPVLISKIFRIPYVIEVNGLLIDEEKMIGRPKVLTRLTGLNEKLNYKQADKIVAVTQGIKDGIKELHSIPDEKIVVIENGANTDLFKPMHQEKAKKELKLEETKNYICFVGNLAPWQGVEFLIQSAPLILKESPHTKFLIIGDGPMKEELIDLAEQMAVSDKFIFTGVVPYEEVPKYINASDICVVYKKPLKSGYSPLKLYEYMACEKPVIASRVEGFEILEENHAGILVEPENPKELAKAIIKLLKDERLRRELGENGRKYVTKNHSWEAVARRVAEVCKSVVVEHERSRR